MAVDELARYETMHPPSLGAVHEGGADGAGRDVAVLLSRAADRVRLVRALERAGYRVAIPWQPVEWILARRSPVLVTEDTEGAARLRSRIAEAAPGTACVVLLNDAGPDRYRQLLAAGATALPASSADADVVLAVGAAARALACLPVEAARALAGVDDDRPVVTGREASWLRALVQGATVAGLARSIGYSEREMYRLLGNLYARLGAETRTEALLRADRWGLLNAPTGTSARSTGRIPRAPVPRSRAAQN